METLLNSLETKLKQKLQFDHRTGIISNSIRKPLYFLGENNSLKFVGNWMNRRLRWDYILKAYSALEENSTYQFASEQIRDYLNYESLDDSSYNTDVISAMTELNEAFSEIDKICDLSLINRMSRISLHILHHEFTTNLSWIVTETEWTFQASQLNGNWMFGSNPKDIGLTRTFKRGELPLQISQMIQDYINMKNIQSTFGNSERFEDRFPLFSDYLLKKLHLTSKEYERFAVYVSEKIGITPRDFELELANSRKKNKIQSTMFSSYKLGGSEPVFLYKKEAKNTYSSDVIYFKLR